ncbi:Proline-rich protein HUA1, partial [Leucoagaricus sp. SymC.cos]
AMSSSTTNMPPRDDPLDEPPPYTPRADPLQGETTVEYGPSRPFQQPPASSRQPQAPASRPIASHLQPQPTGSYRRGGRSLWQQLTDQIDQFANELERRTATANTRYVSPQRTDASWSSYPGRMPDNSTSRPTLPRNVPPLPPRRRSASATSLPGTSSDFARDFYAAGTGAGMFSESQGGPPTSNNASRSPPTSNPSQQRTTEDRSPTTTPVPGRPLLREGKLLVYPRGHMCEKCHNTGYKHYDPLRFCKKCWSKYGKPFSGPLAYSYASSSASSNTQNINLQRPLPDVSSRLSGQSRYQPPPVPPRRASFNGMRSASPGGYYNQGPVINSLPRSGAPPQGAIIYQPGDPRLGGDLCWSCNGKGRMSILIDVIRCPICGGCGRTYF